MSGKRSKEISILTVELEKEHETHLMFPTVEDLRMSLAKTHNVATEKLGESLVDFVELLGEVVERLPESCGGYDIDMLTFSLSVDGTGKISLIGELAAGFNSGITIQLRKQRRLP